VSVPVPRVPLILEAEMLRRGMIFDVIEWSEDLFSAERLATQ
jgi:hypothetical protein